MLPHQVPLVRRKHQQPNGPILPSPDHSRSMRCLHFQRARGVSVVVAFATCKANNSQSFSHTFRLQRYRNHENRSIKWAIRRQPQDNGDRPLDESRFGTMKEEKKKKFPEGRKGGFASRSRLLGNGVLPFGDSFCGGDVANRQKMVGIHGCDCDYFSPPAFYRRFFCLL